MIDQEKITKDARSVDDRQAGDRRDSSSRREFLNRIPGVAAVTLAASASPLGLQAEAASGQNRGSDDSGANRVRASFELRKEAARAEGEVPIPRQNTNGDEKNYPNFIGNFSKGLPHNSIGQVDRSAYLSFVKAVRESTAEGFEQVPLGGDVKLVNPLAGIALDLEGTDSHQLAIPAFPSVTSRELADQAVELYWMALCRDVSFTDYGSNPQVRTAAVELSSLPAFSGPRLESLVTPQTLFRGFTVDDVIGPYVSQLLLCSFSYGPYAMNGKMSMYAAGIDYMTDQISWLKVQNGQGPFASNMVDPVPRYIRNGRDFAMFVHSDPLAGLFLSFYNAGMVLAQNGAPANSGNPYLAYEKQDPFGTFGLPFFLGMMGEATARALKAAWYAKWFVHRALRPEEFGGLVQMTKTGQAQYPLHSDILKSTAVQHVFAKNGTYLLPLAFPEGSPQHPSYPEGHATMAGACATILKAAFDGSVLYSDLPRNGAIVTASADGTALVPYTGPDAAQITINGEINKLASNIGQARNIAGVHWRSDSDQGLRLGEAVAISILRDQSNNYAGEEFEGFTITTFDGKTITV